MGIPGSANPMLLGGGAPAYEIEQSLRFDGSSTYLTWYDTVTPDSAARKLWTLSMWIKRTTFASLEYPFSAYQNSNNRIRVSYGSDDKLASEEVGGGGSKLEAISGGVYRDPSAWYHVVVIYDTDAASSENRLRLYVNGVDDSPVAPSTVSGWAGVIGDNGTYHNFGSLLLSSRSFFWRGYIAEVHLVAGQGQEPTEFGEYDDNGVWRPIEYTGTYGTHGYYLKFDPSATNGIGHDHSGNGNHFTASGFTTSGTGTDVMSDTPTNNWCTLNPLDAAANNGLADGNLKCGTTTAANTTSIRGTQAVSSGKWYFEVQKITTGTINIQCGWAATSLAHTFDTGNTGVYGKAISGTTVMIAADFDNNAIWTGVDGTWDNSATTAEIEAGTTTNATHTSVANYPLAPMFLDQAGSFSGEANFNFGQRAFAYTPPTGFNALNTSNLPAPDIADGSDYFNTVLYTGTGSTQSITGIGFQPDFTWVKRRDSAANSHALFDAVRGAGERISSNEDSQEVDNTAYFTSFDSDGFSVALDGGETNLSSATYVAWNWLAGGSGSTNTAGTLSNTVTVSANPSAGFSIVKYTGDGVSNATVGHGLGVVPSLVMSKVLSGSTGPWYVKHKDLSSGYNIYLNWTDAQTALTSGGGIGDLSSSTTFTLANGSSNNGNVNTSGRNYITYCFAEVAGYSKISSWTGNGSSNGPFVYCGFKPAWLLWKSKSSTYSWYVVDSTRSTYNVVSATLAPNTANAEDTAWGSDGIFDFTSNGFKVRRTGTGLETNQSGYDYIFAAFAENPFGGSGVSPATAR